MSKSDKQVINAEVSKLVGDFFNSISIEALNKVPAPIADRVGKFMVANGYSVVFDKWYLQHPPQEN